MKDKVFILPGRIQSHSAIDKVRLFGDCLYKRKNWYFYRCDYSTKITVPGDFCKRNLHYNRFYDMYTGNLLFFELAIAPGGAIEEAGPETGGYYILLDHAELARRWRVSELAGAFHEYAARAAERRLASYSKYDDIAYDNLLKMARDYAYAETVLVSGEDGVLTAPRNVLN